MAKVYECTFSNVNGENTGTFTRTGMSKNYPSPGILYKKNCPDGLHFYVDPNNGGTNNYYALINPSDYNINSNGTVYVWLSSSYLVSWKLVDDPNSIPTPAPQPPVSTNNPINTGGSQRIQINDNPPRVQGTSLDNSGVYGSNERNVSDSVSDYVSYTKVPKRPTYYNDYSSLISSVNTIENNLNIGLNADNVTAIRNSMLHKFNRFLIAFPERALPKTFAHVFFTRPELNIYKSGSRTTLLDKVDNDPYFYYLNKNSPDLLRSLTREFSYDHDFNPFLSNMAGSFELTDESIETEEYGETYTGWKIKYGKHNIKSKTADSFGITYTDDIDYNVFKIHKAWTDYISKVYRGEFEVDRESIIKRTLDYACSVYYFLCGPDGETLLFWTKYTGVFPVNIPSSASSWQKGNLVKVPEFQIKYEYSWKEDMVPTSLAEFNLNSMRESNYIAAKTYEPELLSTGRTFVGSPYIETVRGRDNSYTYKLRFRYPSSR